MELEKILNLSEALKFFDNNKIYLWDVNRKSFVTFHIDDNDITKTFVKIIPESLVPPIMKNEMIKVLKYDVEREISERYLGKEQSDKLTAELREYETFQKLYTAGMRRINTPQSEDEKYFNRLYDKYYKRKLREKKIEIKEVEDEFKCPYVFKANGKIHKRGEMCNGVGRKVYNGYCCKHKPSDKIISYETLINPEKIELEKTIQEI